MLQDKLFRVPLKILVLNDDSLGAETVLDEVRTHGYKVLNRAVTKAIFQRHHTYNRLLNDGDSLSEQLYFDPSDFIGPKVKLSPVFAESVQITLNHPHKSSFALQHELNAAASQAMKDQGFELLTSATMSQEQEGKLEPALSASELAWVDYVLFFSTNAETNIDISFITEHFDGIFFFCHSPLGSKVLPKSIMSLLSNQKGLPLWVFNLQFNKQLMLYALDYKVGEFTEELMLTLQDSKFQQLLTFLNDLLPQAKLVGCADQACYEMLQAFYVAKNPFEQPSAASSLTTSGAKPSQDLNESNICVTHNTYQYLHYLNQIKSLCNTAIGLASHWQQTSVLSSKSSWQEVEGMSLDQALAEAIAQEHKDAQNKQLRLDSKAGVFECSIQNMAGAWYISPVSKLAMERYGGLGELREICGTKINPAQLTDQREQVQLGHVPHILLSSSNFKFNQMFGLELSGARLLVQILAQYPDATLSIVLNKCVYSWLEELSRDSILWQDLAEPWSRDLFMESAKATQEMLSSALQSRFVKSLRQHVQASLADQELYPWSNEQRSALEYVAQRLEQPLGCRVLCFRSLPQDLLKLEVDLVCSDLQADLVRAKSLGIATLELVESLGQLAKFSKLMQSEAYIDGLADNSEVETGTLLRFIKAKLVSNAQSMSQKQEANARESQQLSIKLQTRVSKVLGREAVDMACGAGAVNKSPSKFGFNLGYKLQWDDVLSDVQWLSHVYAEQNLATQMQQYYNEHVHLLRQLGATLSPLLEAKLESEVLNHPTLRQAQLSNYTFAQRYQMHYLGLRYLAQLAHAQNFGDGATVAQNFGQCDLSLALSERLKQLKTQIQTHGVQEGDASNLQAQISELSNLIYKQEVQWPAFKPLSLSMLSFGCSRGDEIFDLLPLFNGQCFTGIDINESAIAYAQKSLQSLPHVEQDKAAAEFKKLYTLPLMISNGENKELEQALESVPTRLEQLTKVDEPQNIGAGGTFSGNHEELNGAQPQLVKYQGAMGLINFMSTKEFFAQYKDQPWPQYDVITVMTVLCRHPETLHKPNATGIYEFSEFMDALSILDKMLKRGGLLCIFNANYKVDDTPLADKYLGVYPPDPMLDRPAALEASESGKHEQNGRTGHCSKERKDQLQQPLSSLAAQCLAPHDAKNIADLPLPLALQESLKNDDLTLRYGNVALFEPSGKAYLGGRLGCKSIYYKLKD